MSRFALALPIALSTMTALPATAQELILGSGYVAFHARAGHDGAVLSGEYRAAPFGRFLGADTALAVGADVTHLGDGFVGAGLAARWPLGQRWFVDASILPGFYSAGHADNDLGGHWQIRSTLGVGVRLASGDAVSLALSHKSNAETYMRNPGLETLTLRWHFRF